MTDDEPLLWINFPAYEAATRHLTLHQRGLLMQLAMINLGPEGPLPLDPEGMRLAVRCGKRKWQRDWPVLNQFFEPGGMPWLMASEEMPEDEL